MTSYGFSKRDAQRLDRTNRRVEQMPDGTGQKQPRRHRPSPQAWAGFAVSATYDSGTDTVTVTCPRAVIFWANVTNAYKQVDIAETSFDVAMNGETSLGIYANCERGTSPNTGVYVWNDKRAGAATSSQLQNNGQIYIATLDTSTGSLRYIYRAESINGRFFGNQKSSWQYAYNEGTRGLSLSGYLVNQPVTPVGYSVQLPADTVGKVYMTWDYGSGFQLDTTTVGHSQYRLVADFATVGDVLTEFYDRLGAMIPGLHPIGVTESITVNDNNGTVHTFNFSNGILVQHFNV